MRRGSSPSVPKLIVLPAGTVTVNGSSTPETVIVRVAFSVVGLTTAPMKLPTEPSSVATTNALRTSMGPSESETLTPSEAEYSIVVDWGEMNVQPVAPRRTRALMAADATRRDFTGPPEVRRD